MKKLAFLVAAFAMIPALFASTSVFADSPGQLSDGPNNYKVRNVTQNGAYGQSIAAVCNDTVKYSVTLSNSDFGLLSNLMVSANLGSGAINASATNTAGNTTSVSGTATVSTTGTLNYIAGSTVRITSDGATRTPLSDGVAGAGVNAGNLNGSTAIFVQFEAKVNCETTPPPVTPPTPPAPTTPPTPTELPKTGSADIAFTLVGLGALVASIAYFVASRRNNVLS